MIRYLIIFILLFAISAQLKAQFFTFEKTVEGVLIKENGEKVLFYQTKTKSMDGKFSRANYVHPLYDLDEVELTEDFPDDHLHHRGIFWSWRQVLIGEKRIGDGWACNNFVWDVREVEQGTKKEAALSFNVKTYWKSPLWKDNHGNKKPFLKENTKVIVHAKKKNYRVIDFEISLLATEPNLKIGGYNNNGLSGFSVRMKLPEDVKFTSGVGEVAPLVEALSAGPWIDISGSLANDGGNAGIIMMCHPDNPMFQEQWILRKKRSMQNIVYPGKNPVLISDKEPTILKYRLVVYKGKLSKKVIDELFSAQV